MRLALTAVQQDGIHGLSETQLKAAGVELTGDLLPALKAVHLPEIHADILAKLLYWQDLKIVLTLPVAVLSSKSWWHIRSVFVPA